MDQRKVNVLAREYCDDIGKKDKPIVISHHMMMGLKEGQEKMSKSDPDSAIFMEDSAIDVERKIKKCYCPEKIVQNNPVMDYLKYMIFERFDSLTVKNPNGGEVTYTSYKDLEADYIQGALHPS